MTENGSGMLAQLLANAAAAERSGERRWREFAAAAGDDEEVQSLFEKSAAFARSHDQRIGMRLAELAALETPDAEDFSGALAATSQIGQSARAPEEDLLHNLILASAVKAGQRALYKSLGVAAAMAGDSATETLAREIEQNEQSTFEQVRHFLPSRSKIAFNMLTISEVDPAVETKVKDDRPES